MSFLSSNYCEVKDSRSVRYVWGTIISPILIVPDATIIIVVYTPLLGFLYLLGVLYFLGVLLLA